MGVHLHYVTQRRIKRLFTNGMSTPKRAKLLGDVSTCEHCGALFRRYQRLENALTRDDVISRLARERVKDAVLYEIVTTRESAQPQTALTRGMKWAFAVSGTAGVLLLSLYLLLPSLPPKDHTPLSNAVSITPAPLIAAKGARQSDNSDIGIRVFQVSRDGEHVSESDAITLKDILTFTYTYAKSPNGYLALFGIQEHGEVRWYYPSYDKDRSLQIEGDKIDEPLKDGIDLAVNHTPGWLRIVAIFSEHPIDVQQIEKAVSKAENRDIIKKLEPLAFSSSDSDMRQYSVMIRIEDKIQ